MFRGQSGLDYVIFTAVIVSAVPVMLRSTDVHLKCHALAWFACDVDFPEPGKKVVLNI